MIFQPDWLIPLYETVYFKVLKVENLNALGNHIVVQGGTFRNDAV